MQTEEQGDTGGYGGTTPTRVPTLQQAVETGYFTGTGDRHPKDGFIAVEDLFSEQHVVEGIGDTLLEFLLTELVFQNEVEGGTEVDVWAQACYRIDQIVQEVQSVQAAIYRHAPEDSEV